jgi:hypothetical protein
MRGPSTLVLPKGTKEGERGDSVGYAVRQALPSLLPAFSSSFVSFGYQLSLGSEPDGPTNRRQPARRVAMRTFPVAGSRR